LIGRIFLPTRIKPGPQIWRRACKAHRPIAIGAWPYLATAVEARLDFNSTDAPGEEASSLEHIRAIPNRGSIANQLWLEAQARYAPCARGNAIAADHLGRMPPALAVNYRAMSFNCRKCGAPGDQLDPGAACPRVDFKSALAHWPGTSEDVSLDPE